MFKKKLKVKAPTSGEIINLVDVNDSVFSQKMMGEGFAIKPSSGKIHSPVQGKVKSIFPTLHAILIKSVDGTDLLLHIGLDTVELQGKGFQVFVSEGDRIVEGQLLVEVDRELLKIEGKEDTVILVFPELNSKKLKVNSGVVAMNDLVATLK